MTMTTLITQPLDYVAFEATWDSTCRNATMVAFPCGTVDALARRFAG